MSNAIPEYPAPGVDQFGVVAQDRHSGAKLSRRASILVIVGFSLAGWLALAFALRDAIG